jgi:hypothetical protein
MADHSRQSADSSDGDADQVLFDKSQATPPPASSICKTPPKGREVKRYTF